MAAVPLPTEASCKGNTYCFAFPTFERNFFCYFSLPASVRFGSAKVVDLVEKTSSIILFFDGKYTLYGNLLKINGLMEDL
ncbi:hypothetical protein [Hymenobacter mucosus]|uniref:hypothetical protein n=1 Tax=Hymenobacter mucosus TaxID=1411120 RepID=UPI000B794B7E|nr:hypothetical protein [Hymenobacter mucosus]